MEKAAILQYLESLAALQNSSEPGNATQGFEQEDYLRHVLLLVIYTLTFIMVMIGNGIVLLVAARTNVLSADLKPYLCSLALADICIAIFCVPFISAETILQEWRFGNAMCPIVKYVQQVSVMVSIFTLTAVSIDRFRAVVHPLQIRTSISRKKVVVTAIWFIAMSLGITQLVAYRVEVHFLNFRPRPVCKNILTDSAQLIQRFCVFLGLFVIPFTVLVITYSLTACKLWRHSLPGERDRQQFRRNQRGKKKVVTMLFVTVLAFFMCWLPSQIFSILVMTYRPIHNYGNEVLVSYIHIFVVWLSMAHGFFNPFIYTFMNMNFREEVKKIFICLCRQKCYSDVVANGITGRIRMRRYETTVINTTMQSLSSFRSSVMSNSKK
ncbi:RYamide receptor-like [Ptychodera flava]|uniref:RYamide receptor-like n=1 Tax=Ptychodera flava TaxID=63121 RepID=UPI003969D514